MYFFRVFLIFVAICEHIFVLFSIFDSQVPMVEMIVAPCQMGATFGYLFRDGIECELLLGLIRRIDGSRYTLCTSVFVIQV